MVVETFETAITWDRYDEFVGRVQQAATDAVTEVCGAGSVSLRLTHAYPDGAAPYLTVIASTPGDDPVAAWDEVKAAASEAILAAGGTITHHHAVGRDHAPWYRRQVPAPFLAAADAARRAVDPAGICNPGDARGHERGVIDRPGRPPPHHRDTTAHCLVRSSAGSSCSRSWGCSRTGWCWPCPCSPSSAWPRSWRWCGAGGGRQRLRTMGGGILAAALVLILATTLLPVIAGAPASLNLTPGATIRNYLRFGDDVLSARNLGLNVALFVPFGLGLALWRRWGVLRVVPVAVVLSVLVEGAQYLLPLGRAVDVDDVLLNTVGALLGALTVVVVRRLVPTGTPPGDRPDLYVG